MFSSQQELREMVVIVLFHPLSTHFLKEKHFLGGSCVGTFGTFGPVLSIFAIILVTVSLSDNIWYYILDVCRDHV